MTCSDCWVESLNVGECIYSSEAMHSYWLEEDILQLQQQLYSGASE